jgi:hypothetical protein
LNEVKGGAVYLLLYILLYICICIRWKYREILKDPVRVGEALPAQLFFVVELMKSEPQGPDLMFHKLGNAEIREL